MPTNTIYFLSISLFKTEDIRPLFPASRLISSDQITLHHLVTLQVKLNPLVLFIIFINKFFRYMWITHRNKET